MNFYRGELKFVRRVNGKTLGSDDGFIKRLSEGIPGLKEENDVELCDVILVFCPVVSRAGTDIATAVRRLQGVPESKPVVLVVLHHTFELEFTVPDSSRSLKRKNTLTVDCLFHEDRGLLDCSRNQDALEKVMKWIEPLVQVTHNSPYLRTLNRTDHTAENRDKNELMKELAEYKEMNKQLQAQLNKLDPGYMTTLLLRVNHKLDAIIENPQKHLDDREFEQLSDLLNEVKKGLQIANKETGLEISRKNSPDLRLVLLGGAGSEKSSVGNTILGLENDKDGTSTPTQGYKIRQGKVDGKNVAVLETPDEMFSEVSLEKIRHCIRLSAPGPHAFLILIPVEVKTGEERGMMEKMEEMFGEMCWRNTIIILTVTDEPQENRVEEFIRSGDRERQRLVEKCGNRLHCLNVKENRDKSQVLKLLGIIEKMLEENGGRFYSSEIYQQVRNMERRIMTNVLMKRQENIQVHEEDITHVSDKIKNLQKRVTDDESKTSNIEIEMNMMLMNVMKSRNKKRKSDMAQMQETHKMKQAYGEGWIMEEKELMKIVLSEVHFTMWDFQRQTELREQVKNEQLRPQNTDNEKPRELKETNHGTVKYSDSEGADGSEKTADDPDQEESSTENSDTEKGLNPEFKPNVSSVQSPPNTQNIRTQPSVTEEREQESKL